MSSSFESELTKLAEASLGLFGSDAGSPLVLEYSGKKVPFYEEDEAARQDLVLGGLADATDKVVRVMKSRLRGAIPTQHQSVEIAGVRWKVRSISGSAGDPELRLTLISPNARS